MNTDDNVALLFHSTMTTENEIFDFENGHIGYITVN
ncbi:hypothetical protein P3TCK_20635 [Photobacterium profundum 3TCK]|uniref:Uncharacterized protein n=1 Tax=Photobacterium profundum 3TCK TaxID=314280 RepID=Q1Z929_9GAMM|nr:hypothetical protein P3TCK_20635 [Photobacterium profundum 3TCK]